MPTRARHRVLQCAFALLLVVPSTASAGPPLVTERMAMAERGAALGGMGRTRTLPPIRWTNLPSGRVVLHTLGIRVALPAQPGLAWRTGGYVARDGKGRLMAVARLRQVNLVGGSTVRSYFVQAGQLQASCDVSVKDRQYPTMAGHDGSVTVGKRRWRYRLGTQAATGRVLLLSACTDIGPRRLLVRMLAEGDAGTAWAQEQLDGAKPLLQALAAEIEARRWASAASPARAASVARDRSIPKRVLALSSLAVALPEDGLVWGLSRRAPQTGAGKVPDQLVLRSPSALASTISVEVAGTALRCSDVLHTRGKSRRGAAKPAGLPLGYRSGVEVLGADGFFNTLLCLRHAGRLMVLQLGELDQPVTDARPYAGILQALKDAFAPQPRSDGGVAVNQKKLPPPAPAPKKPPAPKPAPDPGPTRETDDVLDARPGVKTMAESTSTRGSLRSLIYVGTELVVSHRDVGAAKLDADRYPATRVAYLGLDAGALLARVGHGFGYGARLSFGATPDWGALDSTVSGAGSFGGMRAEVNADLYAGAAIANRLFIGLGAGFHGMDGPLTANSSLALSALVGWLPDDPQAFQGWLRVTPVQLFPSNERWVAAPLAIELRGILANRYAIGLEFQYTGPASPDDLIPAEGFAAMLRFGFGLSGATP